MSTSQVLTTASTVIDLTGPLKKKGNLNDILGLSKSTNRSKIRAEKEDFSFESIIFCNPGHPADPVKKKKTLVQAGRGMIALTKKRPVVKFRTVKFDIDESKFGPDDTVHGCTSAIPPIDKEDELFESNKSCHTILSYLETSPPTSTRRKGRRQEKRRASFGRTVTASSTAKKIKFESSEVDIFDDSSTFAWCDDNLFLDEINSVLKPEVSNSEFDTDCFIVDRCPNKSSFTELEKVATAESETTNLDLPTLFYTIDRQPDDTYLSESTTAEKIKSPSSEEVQVNVEELEPIHNSDNSNIFARCTDDSSLGKIDTALEPEITNSEFDEDCYIVDRCPDKSSLTELEGVAIAESKTIKSELPTLFHRISRHPDSAHLAESTVTSVLKSGATDSELGACCWSIDRHSENASSQSSAMNAAVDWKTTNLNPDFCCYAIDRGSSDLKLPNRTVETKSNIDEGESRIKKMRSKFQEVMEGGNEFEYDIVERTNSKKRRMRRRKRRKGKRIDSDNIFQKADATRKKIFDLVNAFKYDT